MTAPHAHTPAPRVRELQADPAVVKAAQWLADLPRGENGIRRRLRDKFRLDSVQIAEAAELSRKMQMNRRAFG